VVKLQILPKRMQKINAERRMELLNNAITEGMENNNSKPF
jgi:hypothetical protein